MCLFSAPRNGLLRASHAHDWFFMIARRVAVLIPAVDSSDK
jgi:hypothetical protein